LRRRRLRHRRRPVHDRAAGDRGARGTEEVAMATRMLRRGLPRVAGGDPWPPAGDAPVVERAERVETSASVAATEAGFDSPTLAQPVSSSAAAPPSLNDPQDSAAAPQPPLNDPQEKTAGGATLRRGLPRAPGGEPWPPAGA